ncbi:toll/interleukin-1 receptor domain-containing protein [Noviherbaspirillum massiliense]|uniref:toll/interleukin-1 receptor domain-containing protein n=1 Tax=Noviherbaspirillum massiliense TaxID=1465823 RepID=UPI00030D4607|nr:toll/interleukin-1 receptor domain-containing protein [Noviherbaspirillum massiliense]
MSVPKVFISYSHDSVAHKAWVLQLATDLRVHGVDASLDQWDLVPGQDVAAFMQKGITESDRVLLVCSENYVARSEAGSSGVGYERLIITADMVHSIDTKKFIPLIRNNASTRKVPRFLGPRLYIDFSEAGHYREKREELLRELLGAPAVVKPPLGENPFSSDPVRSTAPARHASNSGVMASGIKLLDDAWFNTEAKATAKRLKALGIHAYMELRFGLHADISKSQLELVTSVRKSEIHTFGWPIGITLDHHDKFRPHPYGDGIRAEIFTETDSLSGRTSYDYWALRSNADFFLRQCLFEDQRAENAFFFNIRIMRMAEALLFAANLYRHLGVDPATRLSVRVTHRGLAGRKLGSSSSSRHIFPRTAHDDESQVDIVVVLGSIREALAEHVQRIAEPLFMLFDFAQFPPEVYADIVRRFERGEVT